MVRAKLLMHEIATVENISLAFYKAKKGKEIKPEVQKYAKNLYANILELKDALLNGTLDVGNYNYFTIYDPKERIICAASFPERVMHHALMNVCHKYFDNYLIDDTYATRKGKGTHKALERAMHFNKQNQYYLKLDIRKYFDSIQHDVLLFQLRNRFKDENLISVFNKIIESYSTSENRGLPIGNLTSQYFANHYLDEVDKFIKHNLKIKAYVRYMDDLMLWHTNKKELLEAGNAVKLFLEQKLGLSLKIFALNHVKNKPVFLGYVLDSGRLLLSKRSRLRFSKKLKWFYQLLDAGFWPEEIFAQRVQALYSFVNFAQCKSFRQQVLFGLGQ